MKNALKYNGVKKKPGREKLNEQRERESIAWIESTEAYPIERLCEWTKEEFSPYKTRKERKREKKSVWAMCYPVEEIEIVCAHGRKRVNTGEREKVRIEGI